MGIRDSKLEGPFWKVLVSLRCVVRGLDAMQSIFYNLFSVDYLLGCESSIHLSMSTSSWPRLRDPVVAFWCSWQGCDLKSTLWGLPWRSSA